MQHIAPGLHESPVAFAVAGMAAMVGGSTGALFTGIIMVFEMTSDYKAVLPVMIVVAITYAIRKYFSNESIYTLKLLRRGALVPEGLQAAIIGSQNAGHVMHTEFSVQDLSAGEIKPTEDMVVYTRGKTIEAISRHGLVDKNFVCVSETTSMLKTLRLEHRKRVKTILVFDKEKDLSIEHLKGIIAPRTLLNNYMNNAELMES